MSFYREREIKTVRKSRHCEGCGRNGVIAVAPVTEDEDALIHHATAP